jgi:endonuclease/exonuclease/phosphatase family metal-dependent hydrolase
MRFALIVVVILAITSAVSCTAWFGGSEQPPEGIDPQSCRRAPADGTAVRWVELKDREDQEDLEEWCATVGPVVVAAHPEPPGDPPVVSSIAFVTWNIHVGGGEIPSLVRDLRNGVLTGGTPPGHFVLLLQEVYREGPDVPAWAPDDLVPQRINPDPPSGRRVDIIEVASRLGLNLFYVPSMRNGEPKDDQALEDRGNAILSTLPLGDPTGIELPREAFRRVAAAATIQCVTSGGADWNLRVCTTHLATRTGFPRIFESAGIGRTRQTRALLEGLPETPAVLGGDFNTWAHSAMEGTIKLIRERFHHPENLDKSPTKALTMLPDRRLDYLFFDLPIGFTANYTRLDDLYGSDHYPLLGFVESATRP